MVTAMVDMAATDTARGLLSPVTVTAMVAMAATDTARGLLSPATATAAMAVTVTVTAMATATTGEHRHLRRRLLNLQTYKSPCICDQLRVLNYARNKKSTVVLEVKFIFELQSENRKEIKRNEDRLKKK